MRWMGRRESRNVEDRRGIGGGKLVGGGIGALIIGLVVYLLGGDPSQVLEGRSGSAPQTMEQRREDSLRGSFVKVVFADTEDVWNKQFAAMGADYREPGLVLFSDETYAEGCGFATAATGPFYCPPDEKVYIDLSFWDALAHQLNAPGDFTMAYVVAHEVGHHVQQLLGITDKVRQLQQRASTEEANALSVRLELQADFFAGLWAHHAQQMKNILDRGDIEEALNAAQAIGDDRLQQKTQGKVVPESFTHGTSQQRAYWFKKGFETGDINQGNTFAAEEL